MRRRVPITTGPKGGPIRVVLISPKGPLYRHRGGAFGRGLRYMPLTFPTLAALVPDDVDVELRCFDEGIQDVDLNLKADLIGMTVITGTANRAYALAAHFRKRGIPVVMGGPHVTLAPEDAAPHADVIVTGYAEETWPQLLRDFMAGLMRDRYDQSPSLSLDSLPRPRREVLPRRRYLTSHVFEATRGCIHDCEFCVVPSAWGRKPLQQPVEKVVADLRASSTRRAVFVDLNLIADREYARRLFTALIPLRNSVVWACHNVDCQRPAVTGSGRGEWVPRPVDRSRVDLETEPARHTQRLQSSRSICRSCAAIT